MSPRQKTFFEFSQTFGANLCKENKKRYGTIYFLEMVKSVTVRASGVSRSGTCSRSFRKSR